MVIGPKPDADLLSRHGCSFYSSLPESGPGNGPNPAQHRLSMPYCSTPVVGRVAHGSPHYPQALCSDACQPATFTPKDERRRSGHCPRPAGAAPPAATRQPLEACAPEPLSARTASAVRLLDPRRAHNGPKGATCKSSHAGGGGFKSGYRLHPSNLGRIIRKACRQPDPRAARRLTVQRSDAGSAPGWRPCRESPSIRTAAARPARR